MKFLMETRASAESFAEVCRRFGISRKTGYKWLERYDALGVEGLADESRSSREHPRWLSEEAIDAIIEARKEHPTWGPKKLQVLVNKERLSRVGVSTIAGVLKRYGLTNKVRRRPRVPVHSEPLGQCIAANDVWCADFKGHFALLDRTRCYPLTISDGASRYLLKCEAMHKTGEAQVRVHFERAFVEYGLPYRIRTDNGPPFASRARGGLTELTLWWVKLGIAPERIEPGKPQQNGRHERMHRTLKAEATQPAARNLRAQQRRFDAFRKEYNHERPHEALGQTPPGRIYTPSRRPMPTKLGSPEYGAEDVVRRVDDNGRIRWKMARVMVTPVLRGEPIAARCVSDGEWELRYGPVILGILSERKKGVKIGNR